MFVVDLADDCLDDVLDRYEPIGAAILVDDERHLDVAGLHLGKKIGRRHRRRHEQHGSHQLAILE